MLPKVKPPNREIHAWKGHRRLWSCTCGNPWRVQLGCIETAGLGPDEAGYLKKSLVNSSCSGTPKSLEQARHSDDMDELPIGQPTSFHVLVASPARLTRCCSASNVAFQWLDGKVLNALHEARCKDGVKAGVNSFRLMTFLFSIPVSDRQWCCFSKAPRLTRNLAALGMLEWS